MTSPSFWSWKQRYSRLQLILYGFACLSLVVGTVFSLQALLANHITNAQVSALERQSGNGMPSTVKSSPQTIASYSVAPNLPRYLNIPKLGVHARVLPVGLLNNGALAAPDNVFDTGWYNESSQPGQPGAMLIEGHVSSWSTKGVFYAIKTLKPGDQIQIQRGDGTMFTYQVVKSQTYPDTNVNMQSAVEPIVAGKPGLNLITCTGQVKPGTSEFNERIIVYTEQI